MFVCLSVCVSVSLSCYQSVSFAGLLLVRYFFQSFFYVFLPTAFFSFCRQFEGHVLKKLKATSHSFLPLSYFAEWANEQVKILRHRTNWFFFHKTKEIKTYKNLLALCFFLVCLLFSNHLRWILNKQGGKNSQLGLLFEWLPGLLISFHCSMSVDAFEDEFFNW